MLEYFVDMHRSFHSFMKQETNSEGTWKVILSLPWASVVLYKLLITASSD